MGLLQEVIYNDQKLKELEMKYYKLCKSILVQCLGDKAIRHSGKETACQMWRLHSHS